MDTKSRLSRRNFLFAAGAGGAAAAAALASKILPQQAAPSDGANKRRAAGYRLSEHVRSYYRTAKV